jgi:glycerol-3-phosphate dehydrogenase subunit C
MKIVKPVVNQVKRLEADHYGSDCPMAGHHIEHGMADGSQTEHPMSLLRQAYGI